MKRHLLFVAAACSVLLATLRASADTFIFNTAISATDTSHDGKDIVVSNCAVTIDGAHSINSLQILAGGLVTHSPAATNQPNNRLNLTVAHDALIDGTSRIDVSGKGYNGGFSGPGGGAIGTVGGDWGSGGGYGGQGADGSARARGGIPYGSTTQPADWGSKGGDCPSHGGIGGAGGGAVRLIVAGTLTVNGQIVANGDSDLAGAADLEIGGGAGGSVWLTTGVFAGSGAIKAEGGLGDTDGDGGGGGGGRVAVYYQTSSFTGTLSARAGAPCSFVGGAGTIYSKSAAQSAGSVLVDNGGYSGPLTLVDSPEAFSLTITNGGAVYATSSLTLGSLKVSTNSAMTHAPGSATGATITVQGDAIIDLGGSISASACGYPLGTDGGPGAAPFTADDGGGGAHGGNGGYAYWGPGEAGGLGGYGSIYTPTNYGSCGAGSADDGLNYSRGGGAIRLIVGGTLTVNGQLTANGGNFFQNDQGGAAGGSLWLTVGGLEGTGTISANGGNGEAGTHGGGGGGGRIAIYYAFNNFSGTLATRGGAGTQFGGAGTIFTKANGSSAGTVLVDNGSAWGASTPLSSPVAYALTISNMAQVNPTAPLSLTDLRVGTNGVLAPVPTQPLSLTIQNNIVIDPGGSISASGCGYPIGADAGPGAAPFTADDGGGGAHGGNGGYAYWGPAEPGGIGGYGSIYTPTNFGSCGAGSADDGLNYSRGGGVIRMIVGGTLTVNGQIAADGGNFFQNDQGGAAGGSLWLTVGGLEGTGTISANGGNGEAGTHGGGGGGGRIALYYALNNFSGTLTSRGGAGTQFGGAGTLYLKPDSKSVGDLLIENGGHSGASTPFLAPQALDLTVANSGITSPQGPLTVANLTIQTNGSLTQLSGQSSLDVLVLSNAVIDAGGRLDAAGKGFPAATGPGAGQSAPPHGGNYGGGGSYGGVGGTGWYGATGGAIYGSSNQPVNLGSGGGNGAASNTGGPGGGAIRLIVDGTLTVNGALSADGGNSGTLIGGAGSGGSLWIETGTLAGNGEISANGGIAVATDGGGGGGGRIALYCAANNFAGTTTANGGTGNQTGGNGTIYRSTAMFSQFEVSSCLANGTVRPWADYVDVTFSTAVNPATFTAADVVITTPLGANIPIAQIAVSNPGGRVWRISFPHQSSNGHYQFQIGPQIQSLFGVAMAAGYAGGFDISQANWPPRVSSTAAGSNRMLALPSLAGMSYQLLTSTDLVHWQNCGQAVAGDGAPVNWTLPAVTPPTVFYRVTMY